MINRDHFFAAVRPQFGGSLKQSQVVGLTLILNEYERRQWHDLRHLAYILATTQHETAGMMQPIEEYGKGKGRSYGKPDPITGKTYYGRGFVQLTWKDNYAKAGAKLGEDLVHNPENAMLPQNAVRILFDGMGEGWFTGKNLTDYFSVTKEDPIGARRIINGQDKAPQIAALYSHFLTALQV